MRTYYWYVTGLTIAFVFACVGCKGPEKRLNAPPQGSAAESSDLRDYYTYQVDNGMLQDMCIADIHFVPHTTRINSLGVRRLNRYCELLPDDGGTIHLETEATDDELIEARIRNVHDFFASSGMDMTKLTIKTGLPRGRPIDAVEAIRIKEEGTVDDSDTETAESGGS